MSLSRQSLLVAATVLAAALLMGSAASAAIVIAVTVAVVVIRALELKRTHVHDGRRRTMLCRLSGAGLLLATPSFGSAAPGDAYRTNAKGATSAVSQPTQANPSVPDVVAQFDALALRPEGLAFRIGDSPDPSLCRHYQGVARSNGMGVPYLFVTRSGNPQPPTCLGVFDVGNLLIVEMGSRDTNGERLRSNRLVRDWDINDTPADPMDRTVKTIFFDGEGVWPDYGHPGGVQLVGDVLVVPLEKPYGGGPENLILLVDVSDPLNPMLRNQFSLNFSPDFSAGLVGLTPVRNIAGEIRYLMLVTGKQNHEVRAYRSPANTADGSTDLMEPILSWEFLNSWSETEIEACLGPGGDWPSGMGLAHQTLNFVREGSVDGPLYLIGGRNTTLFPSGDDFLDLYRVNIDADGAPQDCLLTHIRSTHVTSHPVMGGGDSGNFGAASGVYISPTGELIIYCTEYENDGPPDSGGQGTVRFCEYRHREMVRPGSPTYFPTADAGGSYLVPEGSSVSLSGSGQPATTKAWVQLFEDIDLGSSLPGFLDDDDWLVIDYDDWGSDDFDDFRKLNYDNDPDSWRWFAPDGCTIRLNDDDFWDSNFPGEDTKTLDGIGAVEEEPVLDLVRNDNGDLSMGDAITSMQFCSAPPPGPPPCAGDCACAPGFGDCDTYYSAAIGLSWDLDDDGSFETPGAAPTFSAAGLDGPDVIVVTLEASHPGDGTSGTSNAEVEVTNVAPQVTSLEARDPLGLILGVDVPVVLICTDVDLSATFTDAGTPDTQTARLDWDDGVVDPSDSFAVFADAFGGVTGQVQHFHLYTDPGTYAILLRVTDDDGGQGDMLIQIDVVDFAGAVDQVATDLHDILGSPGIHRQAAQRIANALRHLEGANGAIQRFEEGHLNAGLVKIMHAQLKLEQAQARVDLGVTQLLLTQTARAVVVCAIVESQASPDKIAMAEALIAQADLLVDVGEFFDAARLYHEAFVLVK